MAYFVAKNKLKEYLLKSNVERILKYKNLLLISYNSPIVYWTSNQILHMD